MFAPSEEQINTILIPFREGKYSKIDRTYVNENFTRFIKIDNTIVESINYLILHKDPVLKKRWEDFLDVTIDSWAELWDIPSVQKEDIANEFITKSKVPIKRILGKNV